MDTDKIITRRTIDLLLLAGLLSASYYLLV